MAMGGRVSERAPPDRSGGRRLTRGQRLAYLGCSVGIGVFSAFNNFTLTLWLASFTSSYVLLGLLGNTRTFEGAIVSPLAGAWSDRIWLGWLGRRRPFILAGGLLSAVLLALTPALGRAGLPIGAGWLPNEIAQLGATILTILLFTVTFNAMDDIYRALLADVAAPEERNGLSALALGVEMVSQVAILMVGYVLWSDRVPDEAFAVTGGLMAVAILVTVLGVREPEPVAPHPPTPSPASRRGGNNPHDLPWESPTTGPLPRGPSAAPPPHGPSPLPEGEGAFAPLSAATGRGRGWGLLGEYRAAVVLGLVMFFYWSGVNAVLPLVSVYVRDILHGSVGESQLLPALMLLSTMLMAIPAGLLGDRFGKRRVMGTGALIIACAAVSALAITTLWQGAVVFVLAGIGSAAVMVLTIPLLSDLVPRQHMGLATGAIAASGSIAAPLAALAAGGLSEVFGPRAIFGLMATMVAIALALLPFTQAPEAGPESPALAETANLSP